MLVEICVLLGTAWPKARPPSTWIPLGLCDHGRGLRQSVDNSCPFKMVIPTSLVNRVNKETLDVRCSWWWKKRFLWNINYIYTASASFSSGGNSSCGASPIVYRNLMMHHMSASQRCTYFWEYYISQEPHHVGQKWFCVLDYLSF